MTGEPILVTKALTKRFGGLVAVDALTTSTIILLSASFLYLWRSLVRGVWFVTGRSERHNEPEK